MVCYSILDVLMTIFQGLPQYGALGRILVRNIDIFLINRLDNCQVNQNYILIVMSTHFKEGFLNFTGSTMHVLLQSTRFHQRNIIQYFSAFF